MRKTLGYPRKAWGLVALVVILVGAGQFFIVEGQLRRLEDSHREACMSRNDGRRAFHALIDNIITYGNQPAGRRAQLKALKARTPIIDCD